MIVVVSNGTWAVKLCSNKILQFLAGSTGCLVLTCIMAVKQLYAWTAVIANANLKSLTPPVTNICKEIQNAAVCGSYESLSSSYVSVCLSVCLSGVLVPC